ncbi:MAG: hypothetical protein Kow0013_03860 [Pararhodobacter sp.]
MIQSVLQRSAGRLAPSPRAFAPVRQCVFNGADAAAAAFSFNPGNPARARLKRSMNANVRARLSVRPFLELACIAEMVPATFETTTLRRTSRLLIRTRDIIRRVNAGGSNPDTCRRSVRIVRQNRDLFEDTLSA